MRYLRYNTALVDDDYQEICFHMESSVIVLELKLPESTYAALQQAAIQAKKGEAEVALAAIQAYLTQSTDIEPLLGLFADDPHLIDQIEADAMQAREQAILRLTEANGY